MMDDKCVAGGGMIGKGNLSTRTKHTTVRFGAPQIPYDLSWALATAAGSRRITA
jgi:hypothetical protein